MFILYFPESPAHLLLNFPRVKYLTLPLGAQDLSTQLDFKFKLGLGRRSLCLPGLLFLMMLLLVFLFVLLVFFLVYSVAVSTCQAQLQRFPCRR